MTVQDDVGEVVPVSTGDGSFTLRSHRLNEHYHSVHGAATESRHVFIEAGLKACPGTLIRVLEIGFGTGLNALLTWHEAASSGRRVQYHAMEPYPLSLEVLRQLDHPERTGLHERASGYWKMMSAAHGEAIELDGSFSFRGSMQVVQELDMPMCFDLVYLDAFAPRKQREVWTSDVFARLFAALRPGGRLVTYCARGEVRRTMLAAGFTVERLKGPPGKREMLRATRPSH